MNKKVIKIKESELFTLLEQQLTHPEKYGKRKDLISSLKSAEYSLENTIKKIEDAYDKSKHLTDEEIGISSELNKCYVKLRKELTELRNILDEVSEGDKQPTQELQQDTEPESLQQENNTQLQ